MQILKNLAAAFKHTKACDGAVVIAEADPDSYGDALRLRYDIHGSQFHVIVNTKELRTQFSDDRQYAAFRAPLDALKRLYADGIAKGREHERNDELRRAYDIRESALRKRNAAALAAGWNAVAATLGGAQ